MKVYLLTEGCYSDYRVLAVFATRELAEAAKDAGGGDSVEEMDFYDQLPERRVVYIRERFSNQRESRTTLVWWPWQGWLEPAPAHRPRYQKWSYGARVYGLDQLSVDKAWQDREAMAAAEREGLT